MGSDVSIDFCRECGMEFPDGPEEVCTLCGNEIEIEGPSDMPKVVGSEIDDDERCAVCKKWYEPSDEQFWDYWGDLDAPAWLSLDHVWCTDCILDRVKKEHPDFESSGLEPDTFLVWKDALAAGIDLGPKLFDIEISNAVYRLTSCGVSREDIVRWLASDCPIDEAEKWLNFFDEFDQAMEWRDAGFRPDDDEIGEWLKVIQQPVEAKKWDAAGFGPWSDIQGWMAWGCTAKDASRYVAIGVEEPPDIEFKRSGYYILDASKLEAAGISASDESETFDRLSMWRASGLPTEKLIELREDIRRQAHEFAAAHAETSLSVRDRKKYPFFEDYLLTMFERLRSIGLAMTVEQILRFWGLTQQKILSSIDRGIDENGLTRVVRQGVSATRVGVVQDLMSCGISEEVAVSLVKSGFQKRHLRWFANHAPSAQELREIHRILELDVMMKVEGAWLWMTSGFDSWSVADWRGKGFSPEDARQWKQEGFTAANAARWVRSGAKSPAIANKRRAAGIEPA